jgi:hypothetical protein
MVSRPIGEDLKINLPHRSGVMKIGFFPVDLEALDVGGPLASLPVEDVF